jgi:hypothetical protein
LPVNGDRRGLADRKEIYKDGLLRIKLNIIFFYGMTKEGKGRS